MDSLLTELAEELDTLERKKQRRHLFISGGYDFCSNDYLGLAAGPRLTSALRRRLSTTSSEAVLGAPASRLLRGTTQIHRDLEERLSRFKGLEASLLFPSGYQANIGLLTAVARPGDLILSDQLNHASLIDGIRLSGAQKQIFPHCDAGAVEDYLRKHDLPKGRIFLVTEAIFSMEGDLAPLQAYAVLAERYGLNLIVDEAHATGVFGEDRGSGLVEELGLEEEVFAVVTTFGKALALGGASVSGRRTLIDFLVNRSRPFIFTTAVPPLLCLALDCTLDMVENDAERRTRLHALADRFRTRLRQFGIPAPSQRGPIVPLILGENQAALSAQDRLQNLGFDVRAIRPPTVPENSARLRISIHANHQEEVLDELAKQIKAILQASPEAIPAEQR